MNADLFRRESYLEGKTKENDVQLLLAAMSLHLTSPVPLFILNESYETLDVLICARVEVETVDGYAPGPIPSSHDYY